jgi:hypothetical protein
LRKFGQGVGSLQEIKNGQALSQKDSTQRLADLRSLRLITDDPNTAAGAALTPLGSEALRRWEELGVADDSDRREVVRALAVVRAAGESDGYYGPFGERWKAMLNVASADFWLGKPFATLLATYLNFEDDTGYNPWAVLSAAGIERHPELIDRTVWKKWAADRIQNNAAQEKPQGWARGRLEEILSRVDDDRPVIGQQAFCMALELRRREREDPIRIVSGLLSWSIYIA